MIFRRSTNQKQTTKKEKRILTINKSLKKEQKREKKIQENKKNK